MATAAANITSEALATITSLVSLIAPKPLVSLLQTTSNTPPLTSLMTLENAFFILITVPKTILDFILGSVLNPLVMVVFTAIFVVSWGLFLGVIIIGFAILAWRNVGEKIGVFLLGKSEEIGSPAVAGRDGNQIVYGEANAMRTAAGRRMARMSMKVN